MAYFKLDENSTLLRIMRKVGEGKATLKEHQIFASFCGMGLRNWQDIQKRKLLACGSSTPNVLPLLDDNVNHKVK